MSRDYALGATIYIQFTTRAFATGVPTQLAGTPVLSVREQANATPITAGVSVTVDACSVTGLNEAVIVATAGNGYETAKDYGVYISTGTVGGTSVVGEVVGTFSIEKSPAGAAGAGLTDLGGMSTTMKAQVQVEADDALVANRLDELLAADSDIDGAAPPAVGSVFHELMSKTAGSFTFDQTTDSNEAIRDRGDLAWSTPVGFSTHTAADVWSVATRLLTAGTNIVLAKGVGITGFNDIAAGAQMDLVNAPNATAVTAIQSGLATVTGVSAVETDTQDIQNRIPAALSGGNMKSDLLAVNANTAAAARLALSAAQIIPGTVDTTGFASTVTEFESDDITEATADHYNGCTIIFTSGALAGQRSSVSDYSLATGRGHFTVVALTEAPANDGTFILV